MRLPLDLLSHQNEFLETEAPTMLVAGYGSGKTYAAVIKTLSKKFKYPTKKVAYYLPTYPLIKDIAFEYFPEILANMGVSYRLNKTDKEIHIANYGKIIFRTMSEPESIVGYEVAYSLIDEADILPKEKMKLVYDKIIGRNRAIENANIDMVSTPEGFKFLYEQAQTGDFHVIRAKSTNNKFLPKSFIDNLYKKYTPSLLRAYLEGEFVNLTTGTVYEYFKRNEANTNEVHNDKEPLYIGQDFNIGGSCSAVAVLRGDEIHIVDEFTSHDTFSVITNLESRYSNPVEIMPDASGWAGKTNASKSDNQLLLDAGFKVTAPRKNSLVRDRVNIVNSLFYQNKLFVNVEKCPRIAEALEQQAYDKNGEPEKHGGAATVDDWNDCLGYVVMRLHEQQQQKAVNLRMKVG